MSKLERIFKISIEYKDSIPMTEDLTKKLNLLAKSVAFVTSKLRDMASVEGNEKILKFMTEYELSTRRTAITRRKLTDEEKEANRAGKLLAQVQNSAAGSVKQLEAQVKLNRMAWVKMSAEYRTATAEGRKMTATLAQQQKELREIKAATGDFTSNIGNYTSAFGKFKTGLSQFSAVLITLKTFLSGIVTPFKDFEYQMDRVGAVSGATTEELKQLEANARHLGETTEYTAAQVAELQLNYARLGFDPTEILEVTQATLDLATATGEDLAKSADIAGATLRGFGLEAKEMPRVIDVMADSFNKSALSLDYFTESMKYVAPIAKTAGVSLEQTTAMLGVLADRGIRGSQAGTALRRILTEISISGKTASEALADLNAKGLTVGDAMDEVGRYAMTALTVLSENAPQVEALTKELDNSAGAAKNAADVMRDNLKGDVDRATSAIQEQAIAIGEKLAPALRMLLQLGTFLIQNIQTIIVTFGAYMAATRGVILVKTLYNNVTKAAAVMNTVETTTLQANMLALRGASAATQLLAAVKLLLTGNIKAATIALKMFGVAMKSTGIGLTVAALVGLVTWFITSEKSASAAEVAQKRLNEAHEEFANKQRERKSRSEELISTIKEETQTQLERVQAFRELQLLYPDVLQNYTLESFLLTDIAKIRKEIAESEVGRKLASDNKALEEAGEKVAYLQQLLNIPWAWATFGIEAVKQMKKDLSAAEQEMFAYYKIVQQNKKDLEEAEPAEVRIASLDKNIENLRTQIAEMEAILAQGGFVLPSILTQAKEDKQKAEQLKASLQQTAKASEDLQASLRKLSTEQLEDKKDNGSDQEKEIAKTILKERAKAEKIRAEKEKAAKAQADIVQQTSAKILQMQDDHTDAEIALMDEGIDKKMAKAELEAKRITQKRDKEYREQLEKITRQQETLNSRSPEYKTLEGQKKDLTAGHEALKTIDTETQASRRLEILRSASRQELEIYLAATSDHKKMIEAEGVLFEKEAQEAIDTEVRKAEAIEKIREATTQGITDAEATYLTNKRINEATITDSKKLHEAEMQNELDLRKAKADTYIAELNAMQALEEVDEQRYAELLDKLRQVKQEAENIGKTGNAEGEDNRSLFQKMFDFSEEDVEQLKQAAFDIASQVNSAIADAEKQSVDRRLQQEHKRLDDAAKRDKKALDLKRKKGIISEKTYQKELEKIDANTEKRKEEADRAAFERKKRIDTKAAIMNTALSVAKTFAQYGWPAGIVPAAIAAAMGAVQVATIQSQKFARGGILPVGKTADGLSMAMVEGASHAQGGLSIAIGGKTVGEMEGGEIMAIINKNSASKYLPQLSAINEAGGGVRFASGGIVTAPSRISVPRPAGLPNYRAQAYETEQVMFQRLTEVQDALMRNIEQAHERIDTLKVVVSESDITQTQQQVKRIKVMSTF